MPRQKTTMSELRVGILVVATIAILIIFILSVSGGIPFFQHNATYLSAYGHTQSVAVHEGDAVVAGQRIATMGAGPNGEAMLYFEIRINGTPGNPLTFVPTRVD